MRGLIGFPVFQADGTRKTRSFIMPGGIAACFTISDDETHSVEVLERVRGNSWMSEYQVKQALKPDVVKATDRRAVFVGLDAYKEAGGQIGGDLFADETFINDPALLDELFRAKLEAEAEAAGQRMPTPGGVGLLWHISHSRARRPRGSGGAAGRTGRSPLRRVRGGPSRRAGGRLAG